MKSIYSVVLATLLLIGAAGTVSAEGPDKGFVVGAETGQVLGIAGLYQINEMVQIGTGLGFQVGDASYFYLSPQARFLFAMGVANLYLAASAEFQLLFGDSEATALAVKVAMQYWFNRNFALYAGIRALSVDFDPSVLAIGLLTPHVGVQVAFN